MNARLILGLGALTFLASLSEQERQTLRQGLHIVRDVATAFERVVQAVAAARHAALR